MNISQFVFIQTLFNVFVLVSTCIRVKFLYMCETSKFTRYRLLWL